MWRIQAITYLVDVEMLKDAPHVLVNGDVPGVDLFVLAGSTVEAVNLKRQYLK